MSHTLSSSAMGAVGHVAAAMAHSSCWSASTAPIRRMTASSWEDPNHVRPSFHFFVQPFQGVVRPDLAPVSSRERTERQHVGLGFRIDCCGLWVLVSSMSATSSQRARTSATVPRAKIERNAGSNDFGLTLGHGGQTGSGCSWTRHLCHDAPWKHFRIAVFKPS